jgi:phosphoribosylformylglycinamidine synthase subunit PurS
MKIRIFVSYKDVVLDPQGQAVKNALHTLGYSAVKDVRQGKVFEISLDGITRKEAEKIVPEIAGKVLANPVIEKYSWQFDKEETTKKKSGK